MGKYYSYQELSKNEQRGKDYHIRFRLGTSGIAIMAPHGGEIEPGTTEIADAVAGNAHSFYSFDGLKENGNSDLHLTSKYFDEPLAMDIGKRSGSILAIHGCRERELVVYLGGRNRALKEKMKIALARVDFTVGETSRFPGVHASNICNRNRQGKGIQMEISLGLRLKMFQDLSRANRKITTPLFETFVSILRDVLSCLPGATVTEIPTQNKSLY